MRKRLFALLAGVALLLSLNACSGDSDHAQTIESSVPAETTTETTMGSTASPTVPPTTESAVPTMHDTAIAVNGSSSVRFGNFESVIPEGFKVLSVEDNTLAIGTEDGECVIGIFAADVSGLHQEQIEEYVPTLSESFATAGATQLGKEQMDGLVGPFDVKYDLYVEVSSDIGITINIDTALTDSWYCYMIMMRCESESDKNSEYTTAFAEFLGYAKYIGSAPRFDFVQ